MNRALRDLRVPALAALLVAALVTAAILRSDGARTISANGVQVRVPPSWQRVEEAGDAFVIDPRTVLVVGTHGARPRPSRCQVAAYEVPPDGAVIVVVRWRTETSGGGRPPRSREPLGTIELDRRGFECRPGHQGGSAQLALGGHAYQVNVMVGDRASQQRVAEALRVARSFDLAP